MVHRYRGGVVPSTVGTDQAVSAAVEAAPAAVDQALHDFDFRRATAAVWSIVDEANRYVERVRPWVLAKEGRESELDGVLGLLVYAVRRLAVELAPFLPDLAARVAAQGAGDVLPPPAPLVQRR